MKGKARSLIILAAILLLVAFFSKCIDFGRSKTKDPRGENYIGSSSCRQCHQSIYDLYLTNPHYHATAPTTKKTLLGSVEPGKNTFAFNTDEKIQIEERDSGFYQVAYKKGKEVKVHRLDITFGIKNAQTFLFWEGKKTYEHPVSYYTSINGWASSPGYSSTEINFSRFIGKDCFECHSSYIESRITLTNSGKSEELDKKSLIYSIDCERCHGPGTNHVNFHLAYPDEKKAKYMVDFKTLSRQQKLDMCAVCHSGNDRSKVRTPFAFTPGDTLENFYLPEFYSSKTSQPDVHGNQYQLLKESECFVKSSILECSSCHSSHKKESSNLELHSQKCISCHSMPNHIECALTGTLGAAITQNCIDCHMPKQISKSISFRMAGQSSASPYLLRTHKIAVYPEEAEKIIAFLKSK